MTQIERYIFKMTFSAFVACLAGLTAVIWITQALRELDLLTGKGQTFWIFMVVTGLSLPALVAIIAPLAVFIAAVYTLNKLNGDSELIVMNAAGMSPARLLRPFLVLGTGVALVVGVMTIYLIPASFNELRDLISKIRADFVTTLVREGQFTSLESGVTFSFRERSGEALLGIFMQDRRDPERVLVYIAERGQVASVDELSYLVLEQGSIQRRRPMHATRPSSPSTGTPWISRPSRRAAKPACTNRANARRPSSSSRIGRRPTIWRSRGVFARNYTID